MRPMSFRARCLSSVAWIALMSAYEPVRMPEVVVRRAPPVEPTQH